MKKLTVLLLALITALSFPLYAAGCNEQEPEQPPVTVDDPEPVDKTLPGFIWDYTQFNPQTNWSYFETNYEDFSEYIDNEYRPVCDETFCLWTPTVEIDYESYNSEGYKYIFSYESFTVAAAKNEKTGMCVGTRICQFFSILPHEVSIIILSGALKIDGDIGELSIDIYEGKYNNEHYTDLYANVYANETCIATCYVSSHSKYCTAEWIEDYLKTHLLISRGTEK